MTEVFCAGTHAKVPSECSHRQYTAEVGWFHLVLLRASRWLAWQSTFWVPYHRPHNTLQEQQQGEHWPEKIPWQLAVSERGFFWGEGGRVVDATNDRKLKVVGGRQVTLCDTTKCVNFWFFSHNSFPFLTPFRVCFHVHIWQSEGACWQKLECEELGWAFSSLPKRSVEVAGRIVLGHKQLPLPLTPDGKWRQVQLCLSVWTGLLFECLCAALQCFSIRLQLAYVAV